MATFRERRLGYKDAQTRLADVTKAIARASDEAKVRLETIKTKIEAEIAEATPKKKATKKDEK